VHACGRACVYALVRVVRVRAVSGMFFKLATDPLGGFMDVDTVLLFVIAVVRVIRVISIFL
jgi:hypothetical protein